MRKLILVALMGLSSAVAFANDNDNKDRGGRDRDHSDSYVCSLRGDRNLRCTVKVVLEPIRETAVTNNDDNERDHRGGSRLMVDCNNGWDLFDRHARIERNREGFMVMGEEDHAKATLKAVFPDRHDDRDGHDDRDDHHGRRGGNDGQDGDYKHRLRAGLMVDFGRNDAALRGYCQEQDDGQERRMF